MNKETENEYFTCLSEAANYARVGRQAIFLALKKKKLKGVKKTVGKRSYWLIRKEDVDAYRSQKYNREKRIIEGEPVIDIEKNRWSVSQAAKVLSLIFKRPYLPAHLYYLLRIGALRASKKGNMWVISQEDLSELYLKESAQMDASKITE